MPLSPRLEQPNRATGAEFLSFLSIYLDLLATRRDALDQGLVPCAHPVSVSRLQSRGLNEACLLWMLHQDHVEHFQQAPGASNGQSAYQQVDSLVLAETSCFALTKRGETFVDCHLANGRSNEKEALEAAWSAFHHEPLVPRYDKRDRLLTWGTQLIKRYRQPSANQELIVCTAEELGWPNWFDDPLPRVKGLNPKVRLHDTIKALNQRQMRHLIHFKGDGSGTRIGWEYR